MMVLGTNPKKDKITGITQTSAALVGKKVSPIAAADQTRKLKWFRRL